MSHTRLALGFSRHRKVRSLSAEAFRLWASVMDLAREQARDGAFDESDLDVVPHCPKAGTKRQTLLSELLKVLPGEKTGLWERTDSGLQIHDYLDWQDSSEQVRTRRSRAASHMKEVRARVSANSSANKTPPLPTDTQTPIPSRSESGSETGSDAGARAEPLDDPGRETICPLDLAARAEIAGVPATLAAHLSVPIESIRHEIGQFVSTWTMGKLAGQRRTAWMGKLRQWVIDQHGRGALRAPGAAAHAARPVAPELPPAPAHESFDDRERAHATRLAKALAGDYGEKLKRAAPDMPASRLRAVVERLERGRPQPVVAVLPANLERPSP